MHAINKKWSIAGDTLHRRGWFALLKAALRFLIKPVYRNDLYYLYEFDVRKALRTKSSVPPGNDYYLTFKVVSSNEEADRIEREGYEFRSYPSRYNDNPTAYRRYLLDSGAIAFCTFMGKLFAAVFWVIPSQSTQDKIRTPPIKVDFANHEVILRGAWTNPSYRGLEPFRFTARNLILATRNLYRFLQEKGITKVKSPVECSNRVGQRLTEAMGFKKYGEAHYIKILFWQFWKETRVSQEP